MPLFWRPDRGGAGSVASYTITTDGTNYTGTKTSSNTQVSKGTDFSTVFQAVITDIGTDPASIELGSGTFEVDTEMTITTSNITVKGQGTATILEATTSLTDGAEMFKCGTLPSTGAEGISTFTKGDDTITVTGGDTTAYSVDDYIFVRDDTVIDSTEVTRTQGEIHKIKSKTATTLDIYGEAFETYDTTPTVELIEAMTQNITFQNLSITDARTTTTAASSGALRFQMIDNVTVSNVDIGFWQTQGMSCTGVLNFKMSDCYIHDIRSLSNLHYGVALAGVIQGATISNCNFKETRHGVVMTGGTDPDSGRFRDITVSNCSSIDPSSGGFDNHQGGKNIIFIGCTVEGHSDKGSASSSGFTIRSPTTLSNCRVMNVDDRGVHIFESADASGSSVIGCYFENCAGEGIKVDGGNINLNLSYNTIIDAGDNGIEGSSAAGTLDNCIINGNIIVRPGANGVLGTSILNTVISNNYIDTPTADGINTLTSTTDCQIIGNLIHDPVIGIDLNTANNGTVIGGNTVKNASSTAYQIVAGTSTQWDNTTIA